MNTHFLLILLAMLVACNTQDLGTVESIAVSTTSKAITQDLGIINGPLASSAGFQIGDVIIDVDHIPVNTLHQFREQTRNKKIVDVRIERNGEFMFITLKIINNGVNR
ncbi:MAG: PDZ domain-containing protein [Bdellovibrionota bacterium]